MTTLATQAPPASLLERSIDALACPYCGAGVSYEGDSVRCTGCARSFNIDSGIPQLFAPNDPEAQKGDVTEIVKSFYEENPFPNYDDIDSEQTLMEKARRGLFAKLLDEQIPQGALCLEVGCGTGQLTNFLGMHYNRRVFGSDMCLHSLRLANGFRQRCRIKNAGFVQMNLFRPAFKPGVFDLVVSNGVLHHTADPLGAFKSISRLVKPNGIIIIGLYNKIGRLTTDFRRFLFRVTADKLAFLDAHMRNKNYNSDRKRAWFYDQYKHPHESKHTYSELLDWYESNGFEYLSSIPKIDPGPFTDEEKLFEPHDKGTKFTRWMTEMEMLMTGGADGALYIMIGRKKPNP
ncbi:MAG TPA: class I SAM-dependent methyltransferase [Candidatus Binatia bacterium]|nr:class I SAM-dependent methyltransferase [Candidatus Binatia bacterium]